MKITLEGTVDHKYDEDGIGFFTINEVDLDDILWEIVWGKARITIEELKE